MDHKKIEQAVKLFLEGIGENPDERGTEQIRLTGFAVHV